MLLDLFDVYILDESRLLLPLLCIFFDIYIMFFSFFSFWTFLACFN